MKHIFKTLLSVATSCLPWCIFAQDITLPEWAASSISPLEAQILSDMETVHERTVIPMIILDSSQCTQFDVTGETIIYYGKHLFEYDLENRLIGIQSDLLDYGSSNPISERSRFIYNSNGKITMVETERLNNNNEWQMIETTLYFYDNVGYLIESQIENYIAYPTRIYYTNNDAGHFIQAQNEYKVNGVWKTNRIQTVQRDSANRILDDLNESFNLSTGQLSDRSRSTYEYDTLGNTTNISRKSWPSFDTQWRNKSKLLWSYNSAGKVLVYEKYAGDTVDASSWVPQSKTVNTYQNLIELDTTWEFNWLDSNWLVNKYTLFEHDNSQLVKDSVYVRSNNQWNPTTRSFYKPGDDYYSIAAGKSERVEIQQYDSTGNSWFTDWIDIDEYTDLSNNLLDLDRIKYRINGLGELVLRVDCKYHYRRIFPVSTNEALTNQSVTLAPNPYKIGQTIRCIGLENSTNLTFALYDIAGALVSEQTFDGGTGLVLPTKVKAGMYIAVISQGARRLKTTKIVVVDAP